MSPLLQPGPWLVLVVNLLVSQTAGQGIDDIDGRRAGIDLLSRHGVHVGVDKLAGLGIRISIICEKGLTGSGIKEVVDFFPCQRIGVGFHRNTGISICVALAQPVTGQI